jgi:hypothetical protein
VAEALFMFSFLVGLVITAASSVAFWLLKPRGGVPHRLATAPGLDWVLPMAITSGLVLGLAMIISGAVSLTTP